MWWIIHTQRPLFWNAEFASTCYSSSRFKSLRCFKCHKSFLTTISNIGNFLKTQDGWTSTPSVCISGQISAFLTSPRHIRPPGAFNLAEILRSYILVKEIILKKKCLGIATKLFGLKLLSTQLYFVDKVMHKLEQEIRSDFPPLEQRNHVW